MKFNKNEAISMCAYLIDKVGALSELKDQMRSLHLTEVLGSDGVMTVIDIYQQYVLSRYSDTKLIEEILFWAEGGSYETHLDGYNAMSPKALVKEAKKRGWLVKELPQKTLISSREFPPLTLKNSILTG